MVKALRTINFRTINFRTVNYYVRLHSNRINPISYVKINGNIFNIDSIPAEYLDKIVLDGDTGYKDIDNHVMTHILFLDIVND